MVKFGVKKNVPKITWTFEEGRFWDLWMVVHLLAGIGLGLFFELVQLSFMPAFFLTLILGIIWEVVETKYFGIREVIENQIIDVVIALAGFAVAYAVAVPFDPLFTVPALIAVVVILSLLEYSGWKSFKKRGQ